MITAQDIREKSFEEVTRQSGYNMNEVDDFLDELANDAAATQKEISTLRSKMKVLVDKIEEYRESEDAMRLALVSAQKIAKEVEDESRAKAEGILSAARAEAEEMLAAAHAEVESITGDLRQQREAEELRLQKAQAAAAEYIQKLRMLLEREDAYLNSLQDADLLGAIVTPVPAERPAIAPPAAEPEEVYEDDLPAEEVLPPVEEPREEPEEAPAADQPDYFRAFEDAVYQERQDAEDAIPEAGDGSDAPMFRF